MPTAKLKKISWDQFRVKNENPRDSFETLSYVLFCRKFGVSNGLARYKHQAGIETSPVQRDSKWIGFQAKFFDNEIGSQQVISSLKKAKEKNKNLNKVIFYVNKEFSESSKKGIKISKKEKSINETATTLKIEIEWIFPSHFEILLTQPTNLDLAQLFFGFGDEFGFIKSGTTREIQTFLSSTEYIKLPILNKEKSISNPIQSIKNSTKKTFLMIGHPGAGKSILMHQLFREFGGLNKKTIEQMIRVLTGNDAVPMLINLKNCVSEELENIIRERQKDKNVRGQNFGFIYLFDGLDELDEERAGVVLAYIKELESQEEAEKIIISCRSGNTNRAKARIYFPGLTEYQIADLTEEHIDGFFRGRSNLPKLRALASLRKKNSILVAEAKDILMVKLLWETIEKLDSSSIITDLLELKIQLLLNDPQHLKNIDELNLLDVKADVLMALNQDISFYFQRKFQFRFPREELQKVILETFPRCDYRSANKILNYLSNLFFENSYLDGNPGSGPGFIYRHRRYQEFFFTQKLKEEYEKNPKILRDLDILSAREFFESFFLPYVRKIYERENNVVGLLDLNLIDVYLGKHNGYGVTDAYHMNSDEFMTSLVSLDSENFEELLNNEDFQIKKILSVDINKLKSYFVAWNKDPNNFRTNDYLSSVWTGGVGKLIEHIVLFKKVGKKEVVERLLSNLNEVQTLYNESKFLEQKEEAQRPRDPFWEHWQDWLFIRLTILKNNPQQIFDSLIRANYSLFLEDKNDLYTEETGKDKLVKSFFRGVLLGKIQSIYSVIKNLDEFEFTAFLDSLSSLAFVKIFVRDQKLQKEIKSLLERLHPEFTEKTYFIGFYKKFLGIPFSESEQTFLVNELKRLRDMREVDWTSRNFQTKFAFVTYALSEYTFESLLSNSDEDIRYYDERAVYAALFYSYVSLLQGSLNLPEVVRDYIIYGRHNDERTNLYLKYYISSLWAEMFVVANKELPIQKILDLKTKLLEEQQTISNWAFYLQIKKADPLLFSQLINESELLEFEKLLSSDDYQSYVNDCFTVASFYSDINKEKARFFFLKGIKEGTLRHGWRKDDLVSYQLVDALNILWKNNWETKDKLIQYTKDVFDLALRVGDFTDGKGTWRGPYNALDLASRYAPELAEELREKLNQKYGHRYHINIATSSILLGKVRRGSDLKEIESKMKFANDYDYKGKLRPDPFERRIQVYIEIAESDLYTSTERKEAFDKAHLIVEDVKKQEIEYFLMESEYRDLKIRYLNLCKKYKKSANIILEEEKNPSRPAQPETKFLQLLRKANTKEKIIGLYRKIQNYQNGIVLANEKTWRLLLEKTLKKCGNIKPFIRLLEELSFPHTDFYTANSKYLYIPLAIALGNIQMKPEALKHLHKNTGHGGFKNMMMVYEALRDKEMAKKIFLRYLQLCDFLSN